MRRRPLVLLATVAAFWFGTPAEASADEGSVLVAGLAAAGLTLGANVAFTAYDIGRVRDGVAPDTGWMAAQTILTVPQALLLNGAVAAAAADDDSAPLALVAIPAATWATSLATFGTWSLAEPNGDLGERLGISVLIGANAAFTSAAFGAAVDERFSSPWVSIPTIAATTPAAAYSIVRAAEGDRNGGAYVALSVWSGLLTAHGIVSLVDALLSEETDDLELVYPPEPPGSVTPPVVVPDDDEVIEIVPSSTRPSLTPRARLVPSPVSDGLQVVPGWVLTGQF